MSDYVTLPSNSCNGPVSSSSAPVIADEDVIQVGKYYVTLITKGNVDAWYIASCEKQNTDSTYTIGHLTRVHEGSNLKWKYPVKPYEDNLKALSIVECIIDGEWDVSKERNMTYTLRNHNYISKLVEELFCSFCSFLAIFVGFLWP